METSDCSCGGGAGGCEESSGWTMYFENSCLSPYESKNTNGILDFKKKKITKRSHYDDDDMDMSLISDASSGLPHFVVEENQEDEDVYLFDSKNYYHAPPPPIYPSGSFKKSGKKIIKKKKDKVFKQHHPVLDDTASSAVFDFSNNNYAASDEKLFDISEGHSGNNFEVRTRYYDYQSQYECHNSGKFLQENQKRGGFEMK